MSQTQTTSSFLTILKGVGAIIRDWLTPFYSLGGVTAFAITLLSLIDRSGMLVRWITAALVVITAVMWAYAFVQSHNRPKDDSSPKTQMHIMLLVITLFFGTGLLISEAIMCERRQDSTVEVPAPPPAHPLNQTQQPRQRPRRHQCRRLPNQRQPQTQFLRPLQGLSSQRPQRYRSRRRQQKRQRQSSLARKPPANQHQLLPRPPHSLSCAVPNQPPNPASPAPHALPRQSARHHPAMHNAART